MSTDQQVVQTHLFQITWMSETGERMYEDYDATKADILAEARKILERERKPVTIWTREIFASVSLEPTVKFP